MPEGSQPAPPPPPAPPAAPAAPAAPASSLLANFSQPELLIVGGGLLILLVDIIFGMFGPFSFSNIIWVAAAVAVVAAVLVRFGRMTLPFPYESLLVAAGFLAALSGVRDLIYDLLFISRPGGASTGYMLGAVGLYLGVALMAVGAWLLWRRRPA